MEGKYTKRTWSIKFSVLTIALVIGAYFIASRIMFMSNPIGNDRVGVCVHSFSANEARLVNESGACWIRVDASDNFETAVKNAKTYNLKVLGILDSWMFNQSAIFTLEEWRSNVTYYVSQYADYVDAWEIWNEPANPAYPLLDLNVSSQENMNQVAQFYFSMVQIASPIIRQYDPSAKIVLFGGLNLWSGGDPHLDLDKEFARQLAAMNITQYGDAISVHAYPWMEQVEPWIWEKYNYAITYYREFFNLDIWVTETGHPIDFGGEDAQAQYLIDSLKFFNEKADKFFWYSLLDNNWEDKRFGLIEEKQPRLAYYALQKQLTGKTD